MILVSRVFIFIVSIVLLTTVNTTSLLSQCNFSSGPLGELCSTAYYMCGNEINNYKGRLNDYRSVSQPWGALCNNTGNFDNVQWFSFTPCSKLVTIEISITNCTTTSSGNNGVQAGLYIGCKSSLSVDCSKSPGPGEPGLKGTFRVSSDKFIPGEPGFIFIDGHGGSVCNYAFKVIEGIDTSKVQPIDASLLKKGGISGPNVVQCSDLNSELNYYLTPPETQFALPSSCGNLTSQTPVEDRICFSWQVIPLEGRSFLWDDSTGLDTKIKFSKPGTYTISVSTSFHPFYGGTCANAAAGEILTWTVTVNPPDTTALPLISICPNTSYIYQGIQVSRDTTLFDSTDPCRVKSQAFKVERNKENLIAKQLVCPGEAFRFQGKDYFKGTFEVVDITDCALVHKFIVDEKSVIEIDGGTKFICSGQSYHFQGKSYIAGSHIVKDAAKCDVIHKFNVDTIRISLGMFIDNNILNCNIKSINARVLSSTNAPDPLTFIWKNAANNNTVSQTTQGSITLPGTYIVTGSYQANGSSCTASTSFTISSDQKLPQITASIPSVRCINANEKYPDILVASSTPLASSEWILPTGQKLQGFRATADSINVTTGKPFQFKAIGLNGCQTDTSFIVPYNFNKAAITLTGDMLTCYRPKDTILLTTNLTVDSVRWYKVLPDQAFYGSYPAKLFLEVDEVGVYKAEVMASASKCWSFEQINISENKIKPDVSLKDDIKWHCNTTSVDIEPQVSLNSNLIYTWSTVDGTISSNHKDKKLKASSVGTYSLNVLDSKNGCQKSGDIKIINDPEIPKDILLDVKDISCYGQKNGQAIVTSVKGGYGPYIYNLNQKAAGVQNINLDKGEYTIEVRDKFDCAHKKTFSIAEPKLFTVETPLEVTIAFNGSADLTFTSNYPDDEIDEIVWKNSKGTVLGNDFELVFNSLKNDIIVLEVTTIHGCVATTRIIVTVENELNFFIPNIFSPNNDGINDRLTMFKNLIPITFNQYAIFDRYGNKVYQTTSQHFNEPNEGWDGQVQGRPVETGVYILIIDYVDWEGNRQIFKKDITVVR